MASISRLQRIGRLALLATLAILSTSRVASAGTMPRHCAKMGQDCCCVAHPATLGIPSDVKAESLSTRPITLACQVPSCDCQADTPAPPASSTGRNASDLRADTRDHVSPEPDAPNQVSDTCGPVILSHASPPRFPLYLQLSHLQI